MYKGSLISTPISAKTDIPLNMVLNTSKSTVPMLNRIKITEPGFYDIDATFNLTNVPEGTISLEMYSNGVAIPESLITISSSAVTQFLVIPFKEVIRVTKTDFTSDLEISFRTNVGATVSSALVTIEKLG